MNFAVPCSSGVRDVAFPVLNSLSFSASRPSGVLLVNLWLVRGGVRPHWMARVSAAERDRIHPPGVGVDYYLWSLQLSGVGTLLSGINLTTTILKLRAAGMGYSRMPVFCWTALAANLPVVAAFPVLTVTSAMLLLDRYLRLPLFHDRTGRQPDDVHQPHLAVGPPRGVYPDSAGIRCVLRSRATFSGKPLFGYRSMVLATMAICVLSFMVAAAPLLHDGSGADVNGFFGIMTMIIAVPTGVKIFNWLFTLYGGPDTLHRAGLLGARLHGHVRHRRHDGCAARRSARGLRAAQQPVPDRALPQYGDRRRRVRRDGRYTYWFPKAFGFTLNERLGKAVFWCWFVGFHLLFMPLYMLSGLFGATRRMQRPRRSELAALHAGRLGRRAIHVALLLTFFRPVLPRSEPATSDGT